MQAQRGRPGECTPTAGVAAPPSDEYTHTAGVAAAAAPSDEYRPGVAAPPSNEYSHTAGVAAAAAPPSDEYRPGAAAPSSDEYGHTASAAAPSDEYSPGAGVAAAGSRHAEQTAAYAAHNHRRCTLLTELSVRYVLSDVPPGPDCRAARILLRALIVLSWATCCLIPTAL